MNLLREYIREMLCEMNLGQSFGTIKYTALVLDPASQQRLAALAPEGWKVYAHHMTVISPPEQKGRLPSQWLEAKECVEITAIAQNDQVITGLVDLGGMPLPMKGPSFPHVTIATNPKPPADLPPGRPEMSNEFSSSDFESIAPIKVCGKVEEVR